MRRLVLLAFAASISGCLDPSALLGANEAPPALAWAAEADWALRALPQGDGHDHGNRSHHRNLSTPNFEVVAYDPLVTDYHGSTSGAYYCGEIPRGSAPTGAIAWVNTFNTDVAMVGLDVSDPANPRKVGELVLERAKVYDLSVTPDGKYVVLGTSSFNVRDGPDAPRNATATLLAPRGAALPCAQRGVGPMALAPPSPFPYAMGVVLVDVSDPTNPTIVDYAPQPNYGVHSIFTTTVDDRTLVLASNVNGVTTAGAATGTPVPPLPVGSLHPVSYFSFFEIVEGQLELRSVYRPPPSNPQREPIRNGHLDGTIQKHPLTNQTLAYLADWDGGLSIVDITDVSEPRPLGRWTEYRFGQEAPFGDSTVSGSIHNAVPMEGLWKDGRHYTILGQEVTSRPRDTPTGQIFVIDTTDPAQPTWVSSWTLPVDLVWTDRLLFSTHYYLLQGETLVVTMYHGGMWAVDLSNIAEPRTVGVFVPDRDSPAPPPDSLVETHGSPSLMEVLPGPDGTLVTFDDESGAYVLRFHRDVRVPPVAEWPILEPDDA